MGFIGEFQEQDNNFIYDDDRPWTGKTSRRPPGEAGSGYSEAGVDKDSFFKPVSIDPDRWDRLYPYRLVVWDAEKKQIVGSGSGRPKIYEDKTSFRINFEEMQFRWVFNLPITPQQLSIATQFTSSLSATQRGILEEHNGIKFKIISCTGTMGVWPQRMNLNSPPASPSGFQGVVNNLFGGTIQAAQGVVNQLNRFKNIATNNHPANKPTEKKPEGKFKKSTGYYQALLLDQFLEQYSEAKKNPENKSWRLVFDIPKENQAFIVSPLDFSYSKSVEAPNEVKFRLQLKAWRRIRLDDTVAVGFPELTLTPDLLSKITNSIREARRTLAAAYNLVQAVRSDVQTPFNTLRELSLFFKDFTGLAGSVADLPNQIFQDVKDNQKAIAEAFFIAGKSIENILGSSSEGYSAEDKQKLEDKTKDPGEGISATEASPTATPSTEPEKDFNVNDTVSSDDVNFNPSARDAIEKDLEKIRTTTVDDLIQKRNILMELASQISNTFGAGDFTYSSVYGKPSPYSRVQDMTIDEYAILNSLYDVIQALDSITATNELDEGRTESAFEFVGSLAAASQIPFEDSESKIRLPVPFGLSMEEIAARYLGNPDRWIEIATLNDLRSPYLDEDGFFYNLLSNADGRQFNISTNENLFVGQKIVLSSLTQPQTTRRIINIEKISATNYLITVDGLDNLDIFTISDDAKIRAFLPGTVNSQDQIFIPSEIPATDTVLGRPVPATKGDPLVGLSKIDWLLTESGDIATDSYKDFKLSFGMTNIMQALKMKFATPANRLLKHPNYGAGLTHGISTADLNGQDAIQQIIKSIQDDPRFGDIVNLTISKKGPTFEVNLAVALADGSGVFPINFVLNN